MVEQTLNTKSEYPPIGILICKEHNRVLAKYHLEKLNLPMGISNYELKKILPSEEQLAKCYIEAEEQIKLRKVAENGKSVEGKRRQNKDEL